MGRSGVARTVIVELPCCSCIPVATLERSSAHGNNLDYAVPALLARFFYSFSIILLVLSMVLTALSSTKESLYVHRHLAVYWSGAASEYYVALTIMYTDHRWVDCSALGSLGLAALHP